MGNKKKRKMEKKIIKSDVYRAELIYLIGTKKELKGWILKNVLRSKKYHVFDEKGEEIKEKFFPELDKRNGSCSRFRKLYSADGYIVVLAVVILDCPIIMDFRKLGRNNLIKKSLISTNYHELRHAADVIISGRGVSWDDRETTALIQGWICAETYEPFQKFLENIDI